MSLNPTQLDRASLYVKTTFRKAMSEDFTDYAKPLYAVTPNKSGFARILTLESVPGLRRWLSERRPGTFKFATETKKIGKWEQSVAINNDDIEDDDLGIYKSAIEEMALENKLAYGVLAVEATMKGFTVTMEDGNAFFSSAHGNLQAGALNASNYEAARLKVNTQRDAKGRSYGYLADTLIVGPTNESAARAIIEKEYLSGGESNTNYHTAKIVVIPSITDSSWYVADLSRKAKPVEIQERRAVGPLRQIMKDREDDQDVATFGTDGRFDASYSNYRLIAGSTGS
jgi:phage major head subunit gpT-like protein